MESFHQADKVKLVVSDCHLSAGRYFNGKLNPLEDFHFDDEMSELFDFYSTGHYGEVNGKPVEVELVIAGDYFDFLNVPIDGEFDDAVTEEIAVQKVKAIIDGHPKVMSAIKRFASRENKKVTYLIGNHDADLFFEGVRKEITQAWDPQGVYPSESVKVIHDTDRLTYEEGFEIRHGCQDDPGSELNFKKPIIRTRRGRELLNMPWSSLYVLKVINRMKLEREYIDKVRPVRALVIFGIILDPLFTLKFIFLSSWYFIKTRVKLSRFTWRNIKQAVTQAKDRNQFFQNLEGAARRALDENAELNTVIFGHTHYPMNHIFPDGKQYINTGTWTQMINVDWSAIGQRFHRTYALVHVRSGQAECELREWMGHSDPHREFRR